jgi:hypothetical protein
MGGSSFRPSAAKSMAGIGGLQGSEFRVQGSGFRDLGFRV